MWQLGDKYREVLTLRFAAELSVAQIASVLGRTESSVKVLQHRGLMKLRGLMRDESDV